MTPANAVLAQYFIATGVAIFLLLRFTGVVSEQAVARRARAIDMALVLLALFAGVNYFYGLRSGGSWLQRWDLYHTVMSARFFDELRYDGLYECTYVIGGEETGEFVGATVGRDLRDNQMVEMRDLAASSGCDERFTPERREAFVRDVRFWRSIVPDERWRLMFKDKGYNGTPYVTVLSQALFAHGELSAGRLRTTALLDVLLMLLAFVIVARVFGLRAALVAFVFFCVCYPNRFSHMGGSVFRFSYVAYLLVAAAMIKRGRLGVAGVLIALAGMERMFPFLFAVGVFVRIVADVIGDRRLAPEYRRFTIGFATTVAVCFGLSVVVNGFETWAGFFHNMQTHGKQTAAFRIGLRHLFMFGGNMFGPDGFLSFAEKEVLFRSRLLPYALLAVALFVPLVARVRRLSLLTFTIVFGALSFFVLLYATRYYYSVLVLLMLVELPRARVANAFLLFLISAIAYGIAAINPFRSFLYNTLFSSLLLGYFVFLLTALWYETTPAFARGLQRRRAVLQTSLPVLIVLLSAAAAYGLVKELRRPQDANGPVRWGASTTSPLLDDVVGIVDAVAKGANPTVTRLDAQCFGAHASVWRQGRLRASAWSDDGLIGEAILEAARTAMGAAAWQEGDEVAIYVMRERVKFDPRQAEHYESSLHRGLRGLELEYAGTRVRYAATEIVARNLSLQSAIATAAGEFGLDEQEIEARVVNGWWTEGEQFLVRLGSETTGALLFRGNEVVPIEAVTQDNVADLAQGMIEWLVLQTNDDGRLEYMVLPSGGHVELNNMIRQWMGTLAMSRYGRERSDAAVTGVAEGNIRYNLREYYRVEEGLGLIELDNRVKLGGVALAALATYEHPDRDQFETERDALLRTVTHLHHPDGSFRTFYRPRDRNDNQNFYPGEALLMWATLYADAPDDALLERIMSSFRYYREWHRENTNPAFIPWHTQAYALVWRETRDAELLDFIFEMNDWLMSFQQWDAVYPDHVGRFHDPERMQFGAPHASSTGVYVEGLIEAWDVAREVGDTERMEAYRRAIVGGLRSLMQLQFTNEVDMFYVEDRTRVEGGIRTTVHNNVIRVDNVQHGFLGIMRVLDRFSPADYQLEPN